ncbi:MAG: hypothetical protein ABWW69_06745, partial [Pyrodictiaceae archaeon]
MGLEKLEEASRLLETNIRRIREGIPEARSALESKTNTLIYSITNMMDKARVLLLRAKCIVEAKNIDSVLKPLCITWRIIEYNNSISLIRVKPATSLVFSEGRIRFSRSHVVFEVDGAKVKFCKNNYCREANMLDRDVIARQLYQFNYLAREADYLLSKSLDSITL